MSLAGPRARLLLVALVAAAAATGSGGKRVADDAQFGLIGSQQLNLAPARLANGLLRTRRQIQYPQPAQAPAQQSTGLLGALGDLGPQVGSGTQMFSSLFGPAGQQQQSGLANAAQLMSQLSELVRATQDRTAKMVASTQQSVAAAGQQTAAAAQNAQGGIQAALTEIGQGLQRLALNNPNLLPDIKSLYQSVSSKLTSASSSVAQAANPAATSSAIRPARNSEQFADNLAKLAVPGLGTPVATPSG